MTTCSSHKIVIDILDALNEEFGSVRVNKWNFVWGLSRFYETAGS